MGPLEPRGERIQARTVAAQTDGEDFTQLGTLDNDLAVRFIFLGEARCRSSILDFDLWLLVDETRSKVRASLKHLPG